MRRKLAAGNWKMNGTTTELERLSRLAARHGAATCDVLICPPAPLLSRAQQVVEGSGIAIGGQDCHASFSGAHTGDVSAEMLRDAGASYVIVGHSERRQDHGETDAQICAKAQAARRAGLVAVVCLGETLTERESGQTLDVIGAQLDGSVPEAAQSAELVIAYEPVWAIGTGKVPTLAQIGEVHDFIRSRLRAHLGEDVGLAVRILYGGSVKPDNAEAIFAVSNVDGALVGGASLKPADFGPIIDALERSDK